MRVSATLRPTPYTLHPLTRGLEAVDTLIQDLRYALRTLARSPGFSVLIVLTLALGIGATSAMFGIINAVLLRPLPYPDAGRLVAVEVSSRGPLAGGVVGHPTYFTWRRDSRSFAALAAYTGTEANLEGPAGPMDVNGARVSFNFFAALGVAPRSGRTFAEAEERPGQRVVVLSDRLWRRTYPDQASPIGTTVRLDGVPYTVVGVMPPTFRFPRWAEYWTPLGLEPPAAAGGAGMVRFLSVVGRLAPGASSERARSDLATILRRDDAARPSQERGAQPVVQSLHERLYGAGRPALLVLAGAVVFVLLIACANVAGLMLARGAGREREFAIRAALGASRWRVGRQVVLESLLLAVVGGALGLLVPAWGIGVFAALAPQAAAATEGLRVNGAVVAAAVGAALVTGALFGLGPALAASRSDVAGALKAGSPQSGARHAGLRRALVSAELAVALVLLAGAGLLTRSFLRFVAVDPGFHGEGVLAVTLRLPQAAYPTQAAQVAFFDRLLERVGALPGAQSAAAAEALPLHGFIMMGPVGVGDAAPAFDPSTLAAFNAVTPSYFRTLGVPLVRGRVFSDADGPAGQPVAIVNEAFARARYGGADPIGRRLFLRSPVEVHPVVVGVVADVRQLGDNVAATPEVFRPLAQTGEPPSFVAVATAGDPLALAGAVRQAVLALDPDEPVADVADLHQVLDETYAPRRLRAALLGGFAAVALLLAALGLFGVMAHLVTQRTREIGIRMALGADISAVLRLVVLEGARLVGTGLVLGLAAALALTRLLSGLLFGVSATDPATFVIGSAVLAAAGLLACWVPALRAAKLDPVVALRSE